MSSEVPTPLPCGRGFVSEPLAQASRQVTSETPTPVPGFMAEDNLAELQSVSERILIVDAQPIFRRGVAVLLSRRFAKAYLEEASDVNDAAARLRKDTWDLVILDLWLPDGSGLDLLKELHKSHPEIPVLVVSTFQKTSTQWRFYDAAAWVT